MSVFKGHLMFVHVHTTVDRCGSNRISVSSTPLLGRYQELACHIIGAYSSQDILVAAAMLRQTGREAATTHVCSAWLSVEYRASSVKCCGLWVTPCQL